MAIRAIGQLGGRAADNVRENCVQIERNKQQQKQDKQTWIKHQILGLEQTNEFASLEFIIIINIIIKTVIVYIMYSVKSSHWNCIV